MVPVAGKATGNQAELLLQLIASAVYKIESIGYFGAEKGYPQMLFSLPDQTLLQKLSP